MMDDRRLLIAVATSIYSRNRFSIKIGEALAEAEELISIVDDRIKSKEEEKKENGPKN